MCSRLSITIDRSLGSGFFVESSKMADKYQVHTAHRQCIIDSAKEEQRSGNVGNLEKICIPIPEDSGWETSAEWVWAFPVSKDVYSLDNIPIYAYGFARGDHVRTVINDGAHEVIEVIARGGHSTYRIMSTDTIDNGPSLQILESLVEIGCDWEQGNRIHASIDVPPTTDVDKVFQILADAENAGTLRFEQGHFGHPGNNPRDTFGT
jgi:hypothetical protein